MRSPNIRNKGKQDCQLTFVHRKPQALFNNVRQYSFEIYWSQGIVVAIEF